ncbi:hypothetical protein JG687_00012540 [Phytophthora cactorum]|uniref:Uncharacterized protein n=1 Tax=Phytophthora cactorum TaxID=29920 RepID=A0A8T1U579_9STRA|nr:hypothetical protein JG687_00012540 [Phytophthora cactorum]
MAGGQATNMCVQAYIDTPLFERPGCQAPEIMDILDDTRDADHVFCCALKSPFIAGSKQSLYKHLNNYHGILFKQSREIMP